MNEENGSLIYNYLHDCNICVEPYEEISNHDQSNNIVFLNFESPLYQMAIDAHYVFDLNDLKFPCFTEKTLEFYLKLNLQEEIEKIKLCLIANNKYRGRTYFGFPLNLSIGKALLKNRSWQRKLQANFKIRDEALAVLGRSYQVDVYGKGWKLLLLKNINRLGSVSSKFETLARYPVTIAYENIDFDNYVTEKVPQAIMCGSLPLVTEFTEKNLERPFRSLCVTLDTFLEDPIACVQKFRTDRKHKYTREFLQTYTYESVAQQLKEKIDERYC